MQKLHQVYSIIAAAAVAAAAPAQAQGGPPPVGAALAAAEGAARPVPAWRHFCEANQSDCEVDPNEPERIKLSRSTWQQIVAVNARVNATIKPLADEAHWGVVDAWNYPTDGYGDCEDYQLLKRKLLVQAGLPRRALRMTVVIDEKGEGHAVLMVRTDRGDFILDNKTQAVLPWHHTGYVFVKREGQDGPGWSSLGGAASPATTANR
ncbi:MAG TPA: transglutaminase-like cysteine peptidase [Microvirga sp.]|nr:transglutaminase-like cysteine peptidase [Microvirga sp.]